MPEHLTRNLIWRVKLFYGIGDIANAIKVVIFALYSLFFATTVLKLPGTWVGAMGFATIFWDAIVDPYIGFLTDQKNTRFRRYLSMAIGTSAMGASFWAFFSPPSALSGGLLLAWLLAASFLVRSATSMFSIPYYAVGATLSKDYNERTSITAIRGMIGIIGTALVASLSFLLFFPDKTPGVDPKLNQSGYGAMGLAFGLVMSATALVGMFGARLVGKMSPEAVLQTPAQQVPENLWGGMRNSLQNRSFRLLLISFSLVIVGLTINSSLLLHYLKFYVGVNGSVALSGSQAAFYAGGLAGMGVWLRLAKKFEKHRMYIFSTVLTAAFSLASQPAFGEGHLFGMGNARAWQTTYGIAGFFASILFFIPQSMLADVADESELLFGKRREGALFGMFSFGQQVAAGVAVLLAGTLLEKVIQFTAGGAGPSAAAIHRLALIYSIVPALCFLGAGAVMLNYTLTKGRLALIQAKLIIRAMPEPEYQI